MDERTALPRQSSVANLRAYDPWADLARRPEVSVGWHYNPPEPVGLTHLPSRHISLARGLNEDELRSTLTHELIHLERGPRGQRRHEVEEREIEVITAQRLVCPYTREILTHTRISTERIVRELRVDTAVLLAYDYWRETVASLEEAVRICDRARQLQAWPPAWLRAAEASPGLRDVTS